MTTTMAALSSPSIRHAEFVRLTLPSAVYTFCNAAAPVTVDGITFTNLGSLLTIADIQRDIKATSNDLNISLTGIDSANIGLILSSEIKGSTIEIWRGFLDDNNQIILTPTQQFFKRYQGIINSVSITEQFDDENRIRTATCVLSSSSIRSILENRIAGIITNKSNWQKLYPNDTSMNRVQSIIATYFDFGKKPKKGSQAVADTTTAEE